ncbi:MAG: CCA tRNA nucleotidyltransferase [Planctomycetes bacterium]|nr:CCA tRNA nucleotidyltransferase [Planctomycetota bacterium]
MTDREFALDVVQNLQRAGYTALWAGGCVRDELLGLKPQDYDVATSARPEQLRPLFKRRNEIGAHFGVVQVIGPRGTGGEWLTIEVATFRSDGAYVDGRRPESVVFSSPAEDAQRRDFTINGMFLDPITGELIDFVGGRADLSAKVLRAIGDPAARFTEDKLRVLRAARMATRFDLTIDPATHDAARRMAAEVRVVSAERIAEELRKLLVHTNRARGVALLGELGLAAAILPEVTGEWDRAARVVEALARSQAAFPLVFAALLHSVGASVAEGIALRLRLSNVETARVCWLVENRSALLDAPTMRASKLKPLLAHEGSADLLALHRALAVATGTSAAHVEYCEAVLRDTPPGELNPPPVLTGSDLIALGLKPGPEFKRLLDAVHEAQLDGRAGSKEQALALVRELRG